MTKRIWALSAAVALGLCFSTAITTQAASNKHVVQFNAGHGVNPNAALVGIAVICNSDNTNEFDIINRSGFTATGSYTVTTSSSVVLNSAPYVLGPGATLVAVPNPAPMGSTLSTTYALNDSLGTIGSASAVNECERLATATPTVTNTPVVPTATATPPGGGIGRTPELGSGELLATGLVPVLGLLALGWRRRRNAR